VADTQCFPDALRSGYDPQVLDIRARTRRAARLHAALCAAGLWPAGARILDVGCGAGLLLGALGYDTRLRVGCDLRRTLYLQAQEQAGRVLFIQCEAIHLPFPAAWFDLVTCLAVIEEFADWPAAVEEMARCVAPGGILYVTVTNGRLLVPLYRVAERAGTRIRADWWAYARASLGLMNAGPERGLGVRALAGWRYVHLTPYLARGQWPWLRSLPLSWLDRALSRLAPSFGFAWQRPGCRDGGPRG
jgi:SAM-dependent methyltransferase